MMSWMVWTLPTALFFSSIAAMLAGMTVWEIVSPTIERKGFLPIATTRGDRLFIGLLSAAFIHLGVIGFTSLSIWIALAVSAVWLLVLMRWG
ncbi:putative small integral membrane protein [Vreelandella songnenensis]|uniref:Putative small integral membrane protein n=2 Tax=Vreelandella songnenensis TaxID=1176243 RepID=A0A2T0V6N9_9GAMM|nr:putative small integral membrane protein [Halomonas songnenensis]